MSQTVVAAILAILGLVQVGMSLQVVCCVVGLAPLRKEIGIWIRLRETSYLWQRLLGFCGRRERGWVNTHN